MADDAQGERGQPPQDIAREEDSHALRTPEGAPRGGEYVCFLRPLTPEGYRAAAGPRGRADGG
eukprot:4757939-Pyramimonas_sp.AAC.1